MFAVHRVLRLQQFDDWWGISRVCNSIIYYYYLIKFELRLFSVYRGCTRACKYIFVIQYIKIKFKTNLKRKIKILLYACISFYPYI